MKTNYVLIDYENVQPTTLALLDQEHFKVILFVGSNQTKITIDIAAALQRMGTRAEYIQISGSGINALDFHIAFYIGQLVVQEPNAHFHIISKDAGFDPLIQHLKSKHIQIGRSCAVTDIPIVKTALATSQTEQIAIIIANLQQRGTATPRTLQTLTNTINAIFQKRLSDKEIATLIQALQKQGTLTIQDTKVTYSLPK